jgi:hypothetical protein
MFYSSKRCTTEKRRIILSAIQTEKEGSYGKWGPACQSEGNTTEILFFSGKGILAEA